MHPTLEVVSTPLAKLLGITPGTFDHDERSYTVTFRPTDDMRNHFGTLHGGIPMMLLDDAGAMLTGHLDGLGRVQTMLAAFEFYRPQRTRQPLVIRVTDEVASPTSRIIRGTVSAADHVVASMRSQWYCRSNGTRARSPS
ncbi:MAG: hypothetical protein HY341_01460 [Candidatus Kerfeldbacteria bacterium]|nr:hypothetical protein [Candidatus Kerfeldbacteria bacterium]